MDFLDDYIAMAPLAGEAFATDAAEVMTYIVSFVAGNITAESKIQPYAASANGRLAYTAMKAHYEGVGMNAIDIRGGGRSQGGYQKRARQDSKFVTLTDGRVVESHPSFNFPPDVWAKLPEDEYQRLMELRRVYKQSRQASQASVQHPPVSVPANKSATQVSEVTTITGVGTIMGGRNEQAMRRQGRGG